MKNILVPVDFSNGTQRVVDAALQQAKAHGAKLWLVHVAAPEPDFVGFKTGPAYVREHLAHVLREEHATLQAMAARCRESGAEAEALLVQGPTTPTIIAEAERLHADLLVMGSHGRSGLFRAFVGSVSQEVLAERKHAVLIIPAPEA